MAKSSRKAESPPALSRIVRVQLAHAAGDALVAIGLAGTLFFDVPIGESRARVGLYLLLTMMPFAFVSPVIGPLLDRWRGSYRLAIAAAAGVRAVLAFAMSSRTEELLIYPMAFAMLVLSRAHGIGRAALVPEVIGTEGSLAAANARLSLISVLGGAAAAIPGVLAQKIGGSGATLLLAGVVFGAALVWARELPKARERGRRDTVRGAHRLLAVPLLTAGAVTATARAVVGFLVFLIAFVLRKQGAGGWEFGVVAAAAGAGAGAGALLAPAMRAVLRGQLSLLASVLALGLGCLALAPGFSLREAILIAIIAGIASTVARLSFESLVQRDAPEEVRARTFARYETIFQAWWVAGAGLATAVPFSGPAGMRIAALACAGGVAFALWSFGARGRAR